MEDCSVQNRASPPAVYAPLGKTVNREADPCVTLPGIKVLKREGRAITSAKAKALGLGGLREQQTAGMKIGRPSRERKPGQDHSPPGRWGALGGF